MSTVAATDPNQANREGKRPESFWLIALASLSALGYAALLGLSKQYAEGLTEGLPANEKPTLAMLAILGGLFIAYWCALWIVIRLPSSRWLLGGIFAAACLFRGILLPSIPMHEIDFYRYHWDGAVLLEGASPYRYSPKQVQDAVNAGGSDDAALQQLVELQARSESLSHSLHKIHYGRYPSPYPIVSQVVFALSAQLTPDTATGQTRLVTMKGLLVLFDLATLAIVMLLLHNTGLHPGLSLAYGWCPLLMKEIANGSHLDSIAIFFTTLAVSQLVCASQAKSFSRLHVAITGLVLALAISAKLYPVVLLPLFAAVWLRRQGWASAALGIATTALLSAALLYPLFGPTDPLPLQTPQQSSQQTSSSDEGIQAFLKQWEMNDLLFMVVLENLRQQDEVAPEKRPWFVFTTDNWSLAVVTRWAALRGFAEPLTPSQLRANSFALARLLTGGVFAIVACLLAWFAAGKDDPRAWCRAAMLTLAWFWLTCPTQNPWYWCWVLPLLPFARYRTWHAVAALTILYYLRFWFLAHYPDQPTFETPYNGAYFFYFIIAWVEFVPVFLALIVEWIYKHLTRSESAS